MAHLFVGTSSGVYSVTSSGNSKLLGLSSHVITHLAGARRSLLAAVPLRGPVHDMQQLPPEGKPHAGLHAADLSEDGTAEQWRRVWEGNARSCALVEQSGELLVGSEPADVHSSSDGGATWQGSSSFRDIPGRGAWSFPAPPHQPHVLSLEAFHPPGSGGPPHVVAGIEVGGVLLSTDGGRSWQERSSGGLNEDVHSCRVDPFDCRRWYAVTGRGLYKTDDSGLHWRKLMAGLPRWYTIGLALNPEREGEVLVAAGDRPPCIGVHVAHSTDGGASWDEITEAVYQGDAAEARHRTTPVPYFWRGQAVLGTDTGHLLCSQDEGRQRWTALCRLTHQVLCLAAEGQSPSSIMH